MNETRLTGTRTEKNLISALMGECYARAKYLFYADQARWEGRMELAELFERMAVNETAHAQIWFKQLGRQRSSEENLLDAITGEHGESTNMYPLFAQDAEAEGLTDLAALLRNVGQIESLHEVDFRKALAELGGEAEGEAAAPTLSGRVFVCSQCGHVELAPGAGDPPYACSVCGALGTTKVSFR